MVSRLAITVYITLTALLITGLLLWFALDNFRQAPLIAEENLRGLALTTAAALEGVASQAGSCSALPAVKAPDVAYAAIISRDGRIVYHSNPDLIGMMMADSRFQPVFDQPALHEQRSTLGTGETIYEYQSPFHVSENTYVLRLGFHAWRSEAVVRRSRAAISIIVSLIAFGWMMGGTVYYLLKRKAAQDKLLAYRQELARLGEVGAVLAHEVRNPLSGIKGYAQLLQERLESGKEQEYAGLIVHESLRLEHLVNDMLLYTRDDTSQQGSCFPGPVISEVIALLTPQAEAAGIRLTVDTPRLPRVTCREEGLFQILLNLLTNGLQVVETGGLISLRSRIDGTMLEFQIQDSGPGILPEMLGVLFEPFRTGKARGTGLGLAICKKIVEQCGGTIHGENVPAGGALFTLRLPLDSSGEEH